MNDKISDNPSFRNFKKQLEGFENLICLSEFGQVDKSILNEINKFPELKKLFEELSTTPDKFNKFYSDKGWIAYESMNFEVMKKAIAFAEQGNIDSGEKELIEYYNPINVQWKIGTLKGIEEFKPRLKLISKAFDDYEQKRYYACVPIILMMIDGFVNDIEQKGFFAEGTNLSVWDTIAAHNSGLITLAKLLGQTRRKVNLEEISIPYRNGILHGRDLMYATELVAAKTWAALFCVADWAKEIKKSKKNELVIEPEKDLIEPMKELSNLLKDYNELKKAHNHTNQLIDEWKPRVLIIGKDTQVTGVSSDFTNNSPEKELVIFFENWQKRNYGKIGEHIWDYHKIPETIKKKAGRLREILADIELKSFALSHIDDKSPAITEIKVNLIIGKKGKEYMKEKTFRLIYEDADRNARIRSALDGNWKIIENFYDLSI